MAFRVKRSGGFWQDVDGVITGYKWSTRAPKAGGGEGEQTEWVSLVPSILVDGKKAPETQHMKLGSIEEWTISEDEQIATATDGNHDPRWVAGEFLGSLAAAAEAAGIDARLPDTEAGEPLDLRGIVGLRVRLGQQKDEKATDKLGRRKSKRGAEYDRTITVVTKVYGRVEQQQAATRAAGKAAGNGKQTTRAAAGNGTAFDVDEAARGIVLNLLADAKDNTLTKAKIRVPVIQLTASDPTYAPYRVELQKRIFEDAFLSSIEGVTFSPDKQTLSLRG